MLKQLKKDEKGVIFVTVLMIIIVMMVLTTSMLALNINQILITEGEARNMQARLLAQGILAYVVANQTSDSPGQSLSGSVILDQVNFTWNANIDNSTVGYFGSNPLNIYISY